MTTRRTEDVALVEHASDPLAEVEALERRASFTLVVNDHDETHASKRRARLVLVKAADAGASHEQG